MVATAPAGDSQHIIGELQRQLAERSAQLEESEAEKSAVAEVLGVINASRGDLAPVFDAILEKAHSLCDIAFGSLQIYEDGKVRAVAVRAIAEDLAELLRQPMEPRPGSTPSRLLAGERFVQNVDIPELAQRFPDDPRIQLSAARGLRTGLFVPLWKEGAFLGYISAFRDQVRPFSEKEIALLENFAAQAVIAMENARLITETREALEQQTATAEVLGVINSSAGDLAPVFDAMLEKATTLCEAAHGALFIQDGDRFRAIPSRSTPTVFAEFLTREPIYFDPERSIMSRTLQQRSAVQVSDMSESEPYRNKVPIAVMAVETAGTRTLLSVPMFRESTPAGIFQLARREVRPFSEKEIALVSNFAAQAVIAIENTRLISETREALEQQTATAEVLSVINSSPGDLAPVFDAMLEKAMRLCEAAFGQLSIFDGERFRTAATRGVPTAYAEYRRNNPPVYGPGTAPARVLAGERVIAIDDLKAEPAYISGEPNRRAFVDLGGARSDLLVALTKENAVMGFIEIYRQEVRPFTDKQILLLQNFAAQAVVAMENARLITETREALEQQTATAEVLGVINSSPGDLTPVFDAILEKAHNLCGIAFGGLQLHEGGRFRAVAVRGVAHSLAELLRQPMDPRPGSPPLRLLRGERFVQIEDLVGSAKERPDDPRAQASAEHGLRTVLFVPLRKDAELLGYISAFRKEIRPFSEKEIALLENFAAQAVIAMENARLITETREALEQQTAAAEVLGVINSSPGHLQPVFDAMLDKALRLCDANFGFLMTYDGEALHSAADRGHPEFAARIRGLGPIKPEAGTAIARILEGENLIHVIDAANDPRHHGDSVVRRAVVEIGGFRTLVSVALRKDDALLGIIHIFRQQVRPFSDKQIALLQNFAAQAVIAMENARLITETREALEQQTATAEVLQVINSSPGDLAPVFDAILEKAMHLCGAAFGELRARDGDSFRSAATRGVPVAFAEYRRDNAFVAEPGSLGARILAGEQIVHVLDLKDEDVYRAGYRNRRALVDLGGARTALVASLRKDDAVLGFIIVYRQEVRPFTDKQIVVLQNFADQAVIAMENARLLGELRQRTEEVAELNRGLEARVAEQVEELGRVGRLKRFLAPQLAELIVSQGDEKILESHRREIVVVFCDLRGYTAFTETAEPEEVLDFLREYHGALGPLVAQFEGTLDQFSGDGIMVFFNDPVPIPDPAECAVKMAMAMREAAGTLIAAWRRRGRMLGFGVGIAQGYATLGQIGFADRSGYTAIGTVCNLAARLCAEAKDGQILIAQRVAVAIEQIMPLEEVGELALKGLTQPVVAYNVPPGAAQPALRVIEGGPQSV